MFSLLVKKVKKSARRFVKRDIVLFPVTFKNVQAVIQSGTYRAIAYLY